MRGSSLRLRIRSCPHCRRGSARLHVTDNFVSLVDFSLSCNPLFLVDLLQILYGVFQPLLRELILGSVPEVRVRQLVQRHRASHGPVEAAVEHFRGL